MAHNQDNHVSGVNCIQATSRLKNFASQHGTYKLDHMRVFHTRSFTHTDHSKRDHRKDASHLGLVLSRSEGLADRHCSSGRGMSQIDRESGVICCQDQSDSRMDVALMEGARAEFFDHSVPCSPPEKEECHWVLSGAAEFLSKVLGSGTGRFCQIYHWQQPGASTRNEQSCSQVTGHDCCMQAKHSKENAELASH